MTATNTDDGTVIDHPTPSTALVAESATPPTAALVEVEALAPVAALTDADALTETDALEAQPSLAGAGLISEAELAVRERRWRDALRVLGAIDSIGAASVHTDGLLAIAATHVNKSRLASEAIGRIQAHPQSPSTHRHLAQVAIARHQYLLADTETRAAMDLTNEDPDTSEAATDWCNLAACYAGLGWFDEASDCLDRAERLGATESDTWLVGRSTNHWGLSKTWAAATGVFLFLIVGLLALAVAITVPFVVREFRMTQLDERFAAIANDAWSGERWLRLAHATAVLITVVVWSVAMQLA